MELLKNILTNPIVCLVGYVFSLISALIAIYQFIGRSRAEKKVKSLEIIIKQKNHQTTQGDRSTYFEKNQGPVNIDNRTK